MKESLEGKIEVRNPIPRKLDDEALAKVEECYQQIRKEMQSLIDALERSARLTERDYNIIVY